MPVRLYVSSKPLLSAAAYSTLVVEQGTAGSWLQDSVWATALVGQQILVSTRFIEIVTLKRIIANLANLVLIRSCSNIESEML